MTWKHPHVRGEDYAFSLLVPADEETPPRAWGRLVLSMVWVAFERNTPTCVGKTHLQRLRLRPCEKHPHVRGEDTARATWRKATMETPPRAWGRLEIQPSENGLTRNTPTCVGKTIGDNNSEIVPEKHPHVRGEDYIDKSDSFK